MLISKFSGQDLDRKLNVLADSIGSALPEQLLLFLKKYNGGETPETSFSCHQESSNIVAFYGVGDVKYSYDSVKVLDLNNSTFLPIAFDSFGNDILIALGSGKIYFRDHEEDSVIELSKDLKSFLQICRSEEINPALKRTIQEREAELTANGRGNIITDDLRKMWQEEIDRYSMIHQEEVSF